MADPAIPQRCPNCDATLSPQQLSDGTPTAFCASCSGIWLSFDALARHLKIDDLPPARRGASETHCPLGCGLLQTQQIGTLAEGLTLRQCGTCQGVWLDAGTLPKLRAHCVRRSTAQGNPPEPRPHDTSPLEPAPIRISSFKWGGDRFEYGTPLGTTLTLPLAFAVAWVIDSTSWSSLVRSVLVNMWLHEWSHAIVAWLTGRIAVPLPFITVHFSEERSFLVILLVLGACGALFLKGWKSKSPFLQYLAGGLTLLVLVFALAISSELTLEWVTFAGCAGEFVLGALFVLSFYFRLPDQLRWDAWRYPAAFYGAFGMVAALRDWHESHLDLTKIKWGSALGGQSDMSGDLNRLVYQYDFSAQEAADTYYYLGLGCFAVVWSTYLYYVVTMLSHHPELRKRIAFFTRR